MQHRRVDVVAKEREVTKKEEMQEERATEAEAEAEAETEAETTEKRVAEEKRPAEVERDLPTSGHWKEKRNQWRWLPDDAKREVHETFDLFFQLVCAECRVNMC